MCKKKESQQGIYSFKFVMDTKRGNELLVNE